MAEPLMPGERDVLLVIDMQNDFCPGGALAVPEGDRIVPLINRLAGRFQHVILTQDWHPADHLSFASAHSGRQPFETKFMPYGPQILWPDHCVQGTPGAAFHPDLDIPHAELVLRKGFRREIDSYSAFTENDRKTVTGLAGYLRERQFARLFLAGLAFDFCVFYSAQDGNNAGFRMMVIDDACRAIDMDGSAAAARKALGDQGVELISAQGVLNA
jgi:nicotinamidase/pyrazinamidase